MLSTKRAPEIVIIADRVGFEERAIINAARRHGMSTTWVDDGTLCAGPNGDGIPSAGVYLIRSRSYTRGAIIASLLEDRGELTVNSGRAVRLCQSKLDTARTLTAASIPTLDFRVILSRADLDAAIRELGVPLVIKPILGGLGERVMLVRDADLVHAVYDYVERYAQGFDRVLIAQPFHPGSDVRVIVVNCSIVAAVERRKEADWRTNIATGATSVRLEVTPQIEELVERVALATSVEVFGLDLFHDGSHYVVNEINHVPRFRAASQSTGIDIAASLVAYVAQLHNGAG
jgi:[lysine-biosynthesis-protein LysW]--L-2-aminoadipate ligase